MVFHYIPLCVAIIGSVTQTQTSKQVPVKWPHLWRSYPLRTRQGSCHAINMGKVPNWVSQEQHQQSTGFSITSTISWDQHKTGRFQII